MQVDALFNALVKSKGSDLHCKPGSPPRMRINGELRKIQAADLTGEHCSVMIKKMITEEQFNIFKTKKRI